jgi:hypothetical protein
MGGQKPDISWVSIEQLVTLTGRHRGTVMKKLEGLAFKADGAAKTYHAPEALKRIFVGSDWNLDRERAKLAAAQAKAQEMRNAETRRELVRASDVESWLVTLLSGLVLRLRAVPSKSAPEAHDAETIAACEAAIRKHQDEALEEAAGAKWIGPARKRRAAEAGA